MNDSDTTALPTSYLVELCDYLVWHGKYNAADELADLMEGDE